MWINISVRGLKHLLKQV